jgi:ppGpp synthetase/RelA/SpoT-type nucleotidyltranferase
MQRVLQRACASSIPGAAVQARAKSPSSFAEKCVRKFARYRDSLEDMTDLCGARVIVQTLEQVTAVSHFVEENFTVLERDEKGVSLGEERFGYRDLHFIVQLHPARAGLIGITAEESEAIGWRRAEIQVRTWLQHAWADTLHDRIYKAPFRLSGETKRTGNLLAALMEEGDRNYSALASDLDGMIANYAALASRDDVEKEMAAQRLIMENEPDASRKADLALALGRLLSACGDFAGVMEVLGPHRELQNAGRSELLQEFGLALCKVSRAAPASREYQSGVSVLEEALRLAEADREVFVVNLRRRGSLAARALSRLAWALEVEPAQMPRALELHAKAHEYEPDNPYYLADMLGFEVFCSHSRELSGALRTTLREGVRTCRAHAERGIEMPRSCFTGGRLCVLLGEPLPALGFYARGIQHCLEEQHFVPEDALVAELGWIGRLHAGTTPPDAHRWVMDLLRMAQSLQAAGRSGTETAPPRVVIVSGGAATTTADELRRCRPLLEKALAPFAGRVIGGGTTIGVPGCVGDVSAALQARNERHFETIGYVPRRLSSDTIRDTRYDRLIECGESGFTPEQILQCWKDILADGVSPSEVLCLGIGGGPLSAIDYRVALAFGSSVVVAIGSGGSADAIVADDLWAGATRLMLLPMDEATFEALLTDSKGEFDDEALLAMAGEVHRRYVATGAANLPGNLRPWPQLDDTYRRANIQQARHIVRILDRMGFTVQRAQYPATPVLFSPSDFSEGEIDRMAELEHGRWNVDRVLAGWRPGQPRDDTRRLHDSIVSWADLPESVKEYDRNAVRAFPAILAVAGLEVRRA